MTTQAPAPNVPDCTCDRDDDSWVGERSVPLCPYHEQRLRFLSWDSLACMLIDFEAALVAHAAMIREALEELGPEPNGWHHCRWCTGVDSHSEHCSWVARNARVDSIKTRARAALASPGPTP